MFTPLAFLLGFWYNMTSYHMTLRFKSIERTLKVWYEYEKSTFTFWVGHRMRSESELITKTDRWRCDLLDCDGRKKLSLLRSQIPGVKPQVTAEDRKYLAKAVRKPSRKLNNGLNHPIFSSPFIRTSDMNVHVHNNSERKFLLLRNRCMWIKKHSKDCTFPSTISQLRADAESTVTRYFLRHSSTSPEIVWIYRVDVSVVSGDRVRHVVDNL